MPPLDAALAFAEMDQVAVLVAEDLDLDVPRPADVALEQHAVVAKARPRLALAASQRLGECVGGFDHAHAAPAAAGRWP